MRESKPLRGSSVARQRSRHFSSSQRLVTSSGPPSPGPDQSILVVNTPPTTCSNSSSDSSPLGLARSAEPSSGVVFSGAWVGGRSFGSGDMAILLRGGKGRSHAHTLFFGAPAPL